MVIQKIVIAGAGIIGNSIAYYLAKNYHGSHNLSVTLIDPVGVCPAASAKAGGFLAEEWRDGTPLEELHRLGFRLHQELSEELRHIDYRRLTSRAAAVKNNHLQRKHNSQKVPSTTMEWVDEDVVLASAQTGTENNTAQVHPKKLCEKMWDYTSSKKDFTLKIGRVVEVILSSKEKQDGRLLSSVILEDGSIIDADAIVIAIGPWTEEINSWFPPTDRKVQMGLTYLPTIYGVKSHSMLVKTEKVLSEAVFFESDSPDFDIEVYPRPDGDSYVTGSSHITFNMTERPGQEAVEEIRKKELMDAMQQTSSYVLGGKEPHTVQACYWPETHDGIPVISPLPSVKNVMVATGHNVWGILQGPATGLAVAEWLIEGKVNCIDIEPFTIGPSTSRHRRMMQSDMYETSIGYDEL